jgi:hypothetical protein
MERDFSMKIARPIFLLSFLLFISNAETSSAVDKDALVLATSSTSMITPLSLQEARKLFLGIPLEKDGGHLVPLMNISDPLTYEVFLQKVAFMSASTFETQSISVVFRLGGKRPVIFNDLNQLVNALQQNPGAVTFLWDHQVRANPGLKSVNVLWQGSQQ